MSGHIQELASLKTLKKWSFKKEVSPDEDRKIPVAKLWYTM